MNTKPKENSSLLWLAGIGALLFFVGWPAFQRYRIGQVLREDKALTLAVGRQAGLADALWDQSTMVGKVVDGMQAIDLTGCPGDFSQAYQRHIEAWRQYRKVAGDYGGFTGFFKGVFSGGAVAVDAWSQGSDAQQQISSSYSDVVCCAKAHGVTQGL